MADTKATKGETDAEVLRIPVYLNPTDATARAVCLFQYPLRPRWRPYDLDQLRTARARPKQRRVELTLDMEVAPKSNEPSAPSPLTSLSLASAAASAKTSYAIGMLRTDAHGEPVALSLTPLDEAMQLRPSFAEIDAAESRNKAAASAAGSSRTAGGDDDEAIDGAGGEGEEGDEEEAQGEEDEGGATVAPHFRPAQTEREIEARRSSHAYLVEQREAEPWSTATLHAADSTASTAVREACFHAP